MVISLSRRKDLPHGVHRGIRRFIVAGSWDVEPGMGGFTALPAVNKCSGGGVARKSMHKPGCDADCNVYGSRLLCEMQAMKRIKVDWKVNRLIR